MSANERASAARRRFDTGRSTKRCTHQETPERPVDAVDGPHSQGFPQHRQVRQEFCIREPVVLAADEGRRQCGAYHGESECREEADHLRSEEITQWPARATQANHESADAEEQVDAEPAVRCGEVNVGKHRPNRLVPATADGRAVIADPDEGGHEPQAVKDGDAAALGRVEGEGMGAIGSVRTLTPGEVPMVASRVSSAVWGCGSRSRCDAQANRSPRGVHLAWVDESMVRKSVHA